MSKPRLFHSSSSSTSTSSSAASSHYPSSNSPLYLPVPAGFGMSSTTGAGNAAPVPSPLAQEANRAQYFSMHQPHTSQACEQQMQQQQQLAAQQQYMMEQQRQQQLIQQHQQSQYAQASNGSAHLKESQPQIRQNSDDSSSSETSMHLRNFTLLAEAAERAQVDCTLRDMEEMSL